MAGQRRYDLHVHSTNSDGLLTPEEVLARAGHLAGLAFTDHSGFTYDDHLVAAARESGTELLFPGIEISTKHNGRKYHILGYGRGLLHSDFQEYAFHPTRVKNEIYMAILDDLARAGYELPEFADVLAGAGPAGNRHGAKWMMSKALISARMAEAGVTESTARQLLVDGYERYRPDRPDRYLPTEEVIEWIGYFGGIAAVAHPWWECPAGINTPANLVEDLRGFRGRGLVGLEVSTRHQTVGTEETRRAVAADLDLLPFAGSDFHANGKTELGQFGLTADELDNVRQAAAALNRTL